MSSGELVKFTSDIIQILKKNPKFVQARNIVGFAPIHNEPDLLNLYHDLEMEDKNLLFLRMDGTEMNVHKVTHPSELTYNGFIAVPEPPADSEIIPPEKIDLILVPGLAFDRHGHRLGFGRGYYDRFLKKMTDAAKIGIGFDFQVIDKLPREEHDEILDELITQSKNYIF